MFFFLARVFHGFCNYMFFFAGFCFSVEVFFFFVLFVRMVFVCSDAFFSLLKMFFPLIIFYFTEFFL